MQGTTVERLMAIADAVSGDASVTLRGRVGMSEIKRPWTPGPWLIDNLTVYTLTHGVGRDGRHQYKRGEPVMENAWWVTPQKVRSYISDEELSANARLISAAPDLAEALMNFEIKGPDADGLVWLVMHGHGTTGKGMVQIGSKDSLVAQVALALEEDRRSALRKAGMEGVR